jgi:hypothetical protein
MPRWSERARRDGFASKTPAVRGRTGGRAQTIPEQTRTHPERMVAELVDGAAALAGCEDPLEAELAGALLVAMAVAGGDDAVPAFTQALIPAIEARGNDAALMMLTAIGAAAGAGPEQVTKAAKAAAGRPAANGVPAPAWARTLEQPLHTGPFTRLYDTEGTVSLWVGSFRRAGHEHAVMVVVDHDDCGAAEDILVLDRADLPVALKDFRDAGRRDGLTIKTQKLDAPEFRWYVEQPMQTRAVHDAEYDDVAGMGAPDLVDEENGPGYDVLTVLVRTRLAAFPQPRKPDGAVVSGHGAGGRNAMEGLQRFADIVVRPSGPSGFGPDSVASGWAARPAKLPPKRNVTAVIDERPSATPARSQPRAGVADAVQPSHCRRSTKQCPQSTINVLAQIVIQMERQAKAPASERRHETAERHPSTTFPLTGRSRRTPGRNQGRSPASLLVTALIYCAPEGTRTPNLLIRSQMLYPLSYGRRCSTSVHTGVSAEAPGFEPGRGFKAPTALAVRRHRPD